MKSFVYAAVLTLGAVLPAMAGGVSQGELNFQYRESIPANGDLSVPRAAILSDAEKDCQAAQKTFGLTCVIGDIRFDGGGGQFNYGNQAPPNALSANVNMQLVPQKPN
jgi:hypothetical protein